MKLFDKLKKETVQAGEKAKILIEINKFKIQVSQKQNEIDDELKNIGREILELFKNGNIPELPVEVETSCSTCINKQKEISELELKIKELSNEKKCPQCGKVIELDTKFCPSCGHKFEILKEEISNEIEDEEV